MTGGVTADIVLPIVIAVALASWLSLLFYANAHPSRGRSVRCRSDGTPSPRAASSTRARDRTDNTRARSSVGDDPAAM